MGWSINISKLAEAYKVRTETIVRKIVLDLFVRVVKGSPVDTGRFKGAWLVGSGAMPSFVMGRTDKSPGGSINSMTQIELNGVLKQPVDQPFWLANNLPYAVRLEYGYSQQAPSGMVRIAVREYEQIIRAAVAAIPQRGVA